jgi:hypothetical protein
MRRRDRRHPWNRLERRLFLHFSEHFAVVLDILTVKYTHNIRSMSVKLICIYIHYKTCQTMRLFNPIWKIYSWTSHFSDRKELWFLPPKQNWPPRNNWNIVDHFALFPVPIYDHPHFLLKCLYQARKVCSHVLCVLRISILPFTTILIFNFGIVPTLWYVLFISRVIFIRIEKIT